MEVHAVDVDDIRRFLEGLLNVAEFPDAVPDSVRAGFFVENAVIGEGLLGVDTGSSGSYSTWTSSAASSARLGDSATTAATGSPW